MYKNHVNGAYFDFIKELCGGILFMALLFGILLAFYVAAPSQPAMHSEATYEGGAV